MTLVASHYGVEPSPRGQPDKNRHRAGAKAVNCQVAVGKWGLKGVDIARNLAHTSASVSPDRQQRGADISKRGGIEKNRQRTVGNISEPHLNFELASFTAAPRSDQACWMPSFNSSQKNRDRSI
jgi:hypothetical protein